MEKNNVLVLVTFRCHMNPEQCHCSLPSRLGPAELFPFFAGALPPLSYWAQTLLGCSSAQLCFSRCRVLFAQSSVEGHLTTVGVRAGCFRDEAGVQAWLGAASDKSLWDFGRTPLEGWQEG